MIKLDLSPIKKLPRMINKITEARIILLVFLKTIKLKVNNANPWINAPTTNSSPKKLATLVGKADLNPKVLKPKYNSKNTSNKIIKKN